MSFNHLVCTNEDPNACPLCSRAFEGGRKTALCCGSNFCTRCDVSSYFRYDENSVKLCSACGKKVPITDRDGFRMVLTAAKKGKAWAQFGIACKFKDGIGVNQSHSDAVYWFKKAAEQGHPHAFVNLGTKYEHGQGCGVNLSEAERYYRMAADLHPEFHKKQKYFGIHNLGTLFACQGRGEEARHLLLPLATEGNPEFQDALGANCGNNFSNYEEAATWFRSAAVQGHSGAAHNLVESYMVLGRHALAKFWIGVVVKIGVGVREGTLVSNMKALRRDEEYCGACGKKLGTAQQNMCKQCRSYCYCNRKCQIRHWNRGHKIDCKEVGKLKEKEDELIELFKSGPKDWFAQYE